MFRVQTFGILQAIFHQHQHVLYGLPVSTRKPCSWIVYPREGGEELWSLTSLFPNGHCIEQSQKTQAVIRTEYYRAPHGKPFSRLSKPRHVIDGGHPARQGERGKSPIRSASIRAVSHALPGSVQWL
jgi:hypothetical protein